MRRSGILGWLGFTRDPTAKEWATAPIAGQADGKTTEAFNTLTQLVGEAKLGSSGQAQNVAMQRASGALVLEVVGGKDLSAIKVGKSIVYVPARVVLTMPNTTYGCPTGTTRIKQ